jgi:hypothetical protein
MQMANLGVLIFLSLIPLFQIALSFDLFSSYSVCLVPVKLGFAHTTAPEPNHSNTFEFSPVALPILFSQAGNFINRTLDSNSLNVSYVADDLKGLHKYHENGFLSAGRAAGAKLIQDELLGL